MDAKIIAETLMNDNKSAILALQSGQYEVALGFFIRSKTIESQLNLQNEMARTMVNIVNIYIVLGEYESAYEEIKQALDIFKAGSKKEEYYDALLLEARILQSLGQQSIAEENIKQVILKSKDSNLHGEGFLQLFEMLKDKQNKVKLLEYLRKAIEAFQLGKNMDKVILCRKIRINYYEKIGRKDLAVMERMQLYPKM